MRPILPLALIISTGFIQAENPPLDTKPKVSGVYYWTPSAIFARLKHAKESSNRIEEKAVRSGQPIENYNITDCNGGCVLGGTCAPLQCAPDFHQCDCAAAVMQPHGNYSNTYYPCDVDECGHTTHHCQRYDCGSIEYPINYFQCRPGCLGSPAGSDNFCDPATCALEYRVSEETREEDLKIVQGDYL